MHYTGHREKKSKQFYFFIDLVLKPMLENVETLQRLKELRREALRTYSVETFTQMLLENGSNIEP